MHLRGKPACSPRGPRNLLDGQKAQGLLLESRDAGPSAIHLKTRTKLGWHPNAAMSPPVAIVK